MRLCRLGGSGGEMTTYYQPAEPVSLVYIVYLLYAVGFAVPTNDCLAVSYVF